LNENETIKFALKFVVYKFVCMNTVVRVQYTTQTGISNNHRGITWIDTDLVTRADADESVIYPLRSAKLVFVIPMDKMKCTDDDTYVCE
jgi:hypothetical protein